VLYENPIAPKDMLLDLVIEGTFLGALHFSFSRGLTALIGTKGAGKSAVLECIRFALNIPPSLDVEKYLTHVLGPAGRVWLSLKNRAGEEFLFMRGRGEATSKVVTLAGNVLQRDAVIPSNFPIEIRGWGELTRLAEDKATQLQLLDTFDRSGGARARSEKIQELRSDLPERFTQIRTTLEKLESTKTELDQLQLKKDRLSKLVVSNLIAEQQGKEQRDAESASYREALRVLRENESISFKTISAESEEQLKTLRNAFDQGLLTADPGRLAREAIELAEQAQDELAVRASRSVKTLADAEASLSQLETQFKPLEEKYQQLFAALDPNEQSILLARNDIIKEISRLPTLKARYEQLSADLTQRLRAYGDRLQAIQTEITTRSQARVDVLKKLNESLAAAKLGTRLKLDPCGSVRGNLPPGIQASTAFGVLANQFQTLTPSDAIQRHYDIVRAGGQREEFSLEIDDNPGIEFEKYPGVWQPSEQLSAGQKSTAVLPLVVMLGEGPIILDQPEDNLDNKYIGSTVVRMILAEKARRQFVITSHNATLVVMSDSDLTVEMIDKEGKAQVVRWGFLNGPHSRIRQSVLEVLDGGEIALRRRFSRYGVATG
jgi:chromosome segregation ATPase